MLVNFALEVVGTNISCSKISTDGYECCNLISSDARCRNKGFLAEHFIKPPVDITFNLPCSVNIYSIVLDPFVGRQQSSQLEVFCASKPIPKTVHGRRRAEEKRYDSSSSQDETIPIFYPVSKITTSNQTRVCFINGRFPTHISNQYKYLTDSIKPVASAEMRHTKADLLIAATHVTIRISRIQNGSTPALSNIELWGCVSSHVNGPLQKSIHDKYQAFRQSLLMPAIENVSSESSTSSVKTEEEKRQCFKGVSVPEEFIDPLTCEMMTIPMLLPSGKNVDKSSLDRYFDSEASHGRQPRDPFTGVEFHGDTKPIPNGPLKVRIDLFLSENSNDPSIASLPRTLDTWNHGKRKQNSSLSVSSIVKRKKPDNQTFPKTKHFCFEEGKTNGLTMAASSSLIQSSSGDKCQSSSSDACSSKASNQFFNKDPMFSTTVNTHITSHESSLKSSHESSLKTSLDDALVTLLGSSSVNVNEGNENILNSGQGLAIPSCSKCQKHVTDDVVAYTSPCSHFLCRTCLLTYDASHKCIQCLTCGASFVRSQVVRSYSTTNA